MALGHFVTLSIALCWCDPDAGGTIVGITLACHKHMSATIPCGRRISIGAIGKSWDRDLCASGANPLKIDKFGNQCMEWETVSKRPRLWGVVWGEKVGAARLV